MIDTTCQECHDSSKPTQRMLLHDIRPNSSNYYCKECWYKLVEKYGTYMERVINNVIKKFEVRSQQERKDIIGLYFTSSFEKEYTSSFEKEKEQKQ